MTLSNRRQPRPNPKEYPKVAKKAKPQAKVYPVVKSPSKKVGLDMTKKGKADRYKAMHLDRR